MISLPYVLLFCFYLCTALLEHKIVRVNHVFIVRTVVVLVALLFFGLRGHILTDFINYFRFFENLDTSTLSFGSSIYEPGFVYFGYLAKSTFDNYHFWVFISSAVHIAVICFCFKKYLGNISLGLVFFLGYRGIFIEFNLMQNFMAIVLFMLSIPFIYKRKIVPFFLLNLIGATFHVSSIIYFPLYFVLHRNTGVYFGFLVIVISIFFYFIGSDLLLSGMFWLLSMSQYSSLQNFMGYFIDASSYQLSFGFIERTLLIILITLYCEKIKLNVPYGNIFYNLCLVYYASFLLLSPIDVLADRIPTLFILSLWIVPPALILVKHKFRTILACGLLTLSCAKLILSTQDKVAEYDNLLLGIRSFNDRMSDVLKHNESNK